ETRVHKCLLLPLSTTVLNASTTVLVLVKNDTILANGNVVLLYLMERQGKPSAVNGLSAACSNLRSCLSALLQANDTEVSKRVPQALLLLQKIKGSTRDTFLEAEGWRKRVADQKDLVEAHHLKLQNLMYEKDHLLREIKRCRGFEMKEMDKIDFPEGQLPVTVDPDMHAEHLLRLATEKEAREEMYEQQQQLNTQISEIDEATLEKRAFMESLPAEIAAIEEASRPLQNLLAIPFTTMDHTRQQDAKELSSPLYVLYCELDAYMKAMDCDTIDLAVVTAPPVLPVTRFNSRKGIATSASIETKENDNGEKPAKRMKTTSRSPSPSVAATKVETPPTMKSTTNGHSVQAYELASKGLKLTISAMSGSSMKSTSIHFYYLPTLNIVTVETSDARYMLSNLFAQDTGDHQPNVSIAYAFETEDGLEVDLEFPEESTARPYLWAQWICGLEYHKRNDANRPEPSIRHVVTKLFDRFESQLLLQSHFRRLEEHRFDIHPSLASSLSKPRKVKLEKFSVARSSDQELFSNASAKNSYYRAVLSHDRLRMSVFIEITPEYPNIIPRIVCQRDRGQTQPTSQEINDMETQVNSHQKAWMTTAAKPWILMHQLVTLAFQYKFTLEKMAQQGATLQNYNNELVKCIEDLREKREEVNRAILKEEEEKAKIQKDLTVLTDRLSKINETLARKTQARNEYDRTIQETEAAYMKILESSQTLLHVLKRETVQLTKKKQTST
ncbi:hypothetical protein THRCLA_08686, partial [Thraustotheca clavata]